MHQMLKEWCERNPFQAESKGSSNKLMCIRPKKIIITSKYSLEECFGHDVVGLLEPMQRRLQVRLFEKKAEAEPTP